MLENQLNATWLMLLSSGSRATLEPTALESIDGWTGRCGDGWDADQSQFVAPSVLPKSYQASWNARCVGSAGTTAIDGSTATPAELRRAGIDALVRALGPVGMARFLQQFEPGHGDYTAARDRTHGAAVTFAK